MLTMKTKYKLRWLLLCHGNNDTSFIVNISQIIEILKKMYEAAVTPKSLSGNFSMSQNLVRSFGGCWPGLLVSLDPTTCKRAFNTLITKSSAYYVTARSGVGSRSLDSCFEQTVAFKINMHYTLATRTLETAVRQMPQTWNTAAKNCGLRAESKITT